ncbi:MAG: right-handed parallel beta-helix repeat-containing protein [Blastocatellia bacterium]
MNFSHQASNTLSRKLFHSFAVAALITSSLTGASLWRTPGVAANHPVLVEGELDFDGDGLVGMAEDTDNDTDRVFGTINAALGAANGGANQNGRVAIVTSGRFREIVIITAANGNVTLEAAPGVEANIDAVVAGARANQFPATTATQASPGIVVDAASNRSVTIRNIVSRNWTDGIRILNNSRVTIDNCRLEGNVNNGIDVSGNARVTITNSHVNYTGFRAGAAGDFPSTANQPNPGIGVAFRDGATGTVVNTTVSGSFASGIANFTGNPFAVGVMAVNAFDNKPNFTGIRPPRGSVPAADSPFDFERF